ncbi:hypothetical protein AVEN_77947-1 [Araneus ventricosus]|uniref:Uncharacterized protein n=1 Tax=Araneus ventricosus TaxID=182803 RepID=A0A4Y2DWL5_ARAVE|nr:hypothetical protein AVEN_77947-1 [Araneus ventricosus]
MYEHVMKLQGKSFTETLGHLIPSWITSNKEKSFERNNTRETYQESRPWELNRGQNYERGNMAPVYPPTPRLNEVNELPCEFCNQMWPSELLIEHESGCRPDLVSFPKTNVGNEDDQKFASAAAAVSQISHTPVLGVSPKSIRKEDNEWKVQSRRSNQASIRESIDNRKKERNVPQKQVNAKEKFFFYSSQDTYDASKNQPVSFRKKRYPQMREGQEPSKTKPDKEIGVKKDDLKINQFTSFKFNTSRNDEESQNASDSRKENDDVLSTDVKNYDETKKGNSYDLRALSAESSPMVHYPKSDFNREIRAVGAERTERKRIMNSRKDVDVNKDFEEISVLKSITFDENNKSEPSKFLETMESRTFNLSMPAIWNTEGTLSSDKTLRSPLLKSFDNNYDNEAKVEALSNTAENIDHRAFFSSTQETDYDVKNNETFGSNFVESINDNQNEENENDTRSERSNSDDTFYDADDGGAKYFDTVNDNFRGSSNTQEEKLSHYDFDNLNFSSRNQKENVNPSSHEDLNADVRLEEEDLNQKDCDLDGYFQFLHKSIKQSDETVQRMIGEVEKLSYRTAGDCKCGNKECCCELSSLIQKTSPQACSFKGLYCTLNIVYIKIIS